MPKIKAPMLAGNYDPEKAKFPYLATPKIDGIRFLMVDGVALSRKFKPIRNEYIQSLLSDNLPDGIDGELTSGDTFQSSTSAIMKIKGEPKFKAWIFDYVNPKEDIKPYYLRMLELSDLKLNKLPFDHEILLGTNVKEETQLLEVDKIYLDNGYEGTMLRDPKGTYKFGRSTVKEGILLKVKHFVDDEGILIDIVEKYSNQNEAEVDALGYTKRSSSLAGMVPMNTTGALIVRTGEKELKIGSGLDDDLRNEIWKNKEKYLNQLVKYKYFPQGVKDLPRHPVFIGFRDRDDM
jgi:DNA ligase-1